MRIGLIGLGVVGGEVARLIVQEQAMLAGRAGRAIEIVAVCARDKTKQRPVDLSGCDWVQSPAALAARSDIDVVVELMGGADGQALEAATAALQAKHQLVTANKAMLAKHWLDLFARADASGATIKYEASVCGGVPVIKALREGLAGNKITRVSGILNGTCNYILSTMEARGIEFADALAEAQRLGYAEADPTLDIDGWDTAHKLIVLAKLAFDAALTLDAIKVEGIRHITLKNVREAQAAGKAIRLIAQAERGQMRVAPQVLEGTHPLAAIKGATNAITIEGEPVGMVTLMGPGAGAGPTASAVLADIVDLARYCD